jgi:hypothetical protein
MWTLTTSTLKFDVDVWAAGATRLLSHPGEAYSATKLTRSSDLEAVDQIALEDYNFAESFLNNQSLVLRTFAFRLSEAPCSASPVTARCHPVTDLLLRPSEKS